MKILERLLLTVLVTFSISIIYAQEKEEELPMDIDKLWKLATTNDKSNLTFHEEVNLKVELLKDPSYLENIVDADKTCKALKHYDKLNKDIDCKEWYLSEWEYWKALNK